MQLKSLNEPEPYLEPIGAPIISIMDEYQASSRDLPEPAADFFTPMFQEAPVQVPRPSARPAAPPSLLTSVAPTPVEAPPAPQP